jgi:hypothetical protein
MAMYWVIGSVTNIVNRLGKKQHWYEWQGMYKILLLKMIVHTMMIIAWTLFFGGRGIYHSTFI